MTDIATFKKARSSRRLLAAVAVLSFFCTLAANRVAHYLLPQIPGIGASCIFAALVACAIYLSIRPQHPFGLWHGTVAWHRVVRLSMIWLVAWLVPQVIGAVVVGRWTPYATDTGPLVGFLLFGPFAEELLFRGAVFELSQRAFPETPSNAIWISTLLFSAYHLQIHAYHVTSFVIVQMMFVIPLGYVLARLRDLTGSLWPGLLLHILTNLPNALGPYSRAV